MDQQTVSNQVDLACDEFESAFQSGTAKSLQELIDSTRPDIREQLFRELLGLELELRSCRGEIPLYEEYISQFPQYQLLIASEFQIFRDWAARTDQLSEEIQSQLIADRTQQISTGSAETSVDIETPLSRDAVAAAASLPDRYEIIRAVGEGGMGHVFLAEDCLLNRPSCDQNSQAI